MGNKVNRHFSAAELEALVSAAEEMMDLRGSLGACIKE